MPQPTFTPRHIPHPPSGIFAARFSPSTNLLCSGGADRLVRVYNPSHASPLLRTLQAHSYQILDVAFTQDGRHIASCGGDRTAYIWDLETGVLLRKTPSPPRGHAHRINSVAYGAKGGSVLTSASYDASVRVWDMRSSGSAMLVQTLQGARDSVQAVEVGDMEVLAGSVDGKVRRYDVRAGCLTEDEMRGAVGAVARTRDGNCVLVACLEDWMCLVERETGETLSVYEGHRNREFPIQCAVMCDDGTVLCGSEDGKVHAWDIVEGNLPRHSFHVSSSNTVVSAVDCHPIGQQFATATHDGSLTLWSAT